MKYTFIFMLMLVVLIASCSTEPNETTPVSPSIPAKSTGSTGMGDVLIELTPHAFQNGELKVDISVNTHSVTLSDFDLTQIAELQYNGKSVKPSSAPQLSGHHSSGTIMFSVGEDIQNYEIVITGIPKVEQRVFQWGDEQ